MTRVLALLLVPWILLLASPLSAPWFPSDAWRWGWVAFDVAGASQRIGRAVRVKPTARWGE